MLDKHTHTLIAQRLNQAEKQREQIRAIWLDTWQMADGQHDYAFVHMTLKIGAGRSLESRQDVGDMLFTLIKAHFAALMESRYLALSFELDELHPTLNYKQNNVHALFK